MVSSNENSNVVDSFPFRIAVIDDDESIGELFTELFKNENVVDYFHNPIVFSMKKDYKEYSLIITDYTMPNLNGLELAKIIKSKNSDIPIWLITGNIDIFENSKNFGRLFNMIILKPFVRLKNLKKAIYEVGVPNKSVG